MFLVSGKLFGVFFFLHLYFVQSLETLGKHKLQTWNNVHIYNNSVNRNKINQWNKAGQLLIDAVDLTIDSEILKVKIKKK